MSRTLTGGALLSSRGEVRTVDLAWDGEAFGGAGGEPLDATGCLVLPGLVCGHVRLADSLLPGMPARPGESRIDRIARYRAALDRDALAAAVRFGALEALLSGTTLVFDLWEGPVEEGLIDAIAEACASAGLRAVLSLAVDESRGLDGAKLAIRENVRFHQASLDGNRFRGAMGIADPSRLSATIVETSAEARKAEMPTHLVLAGTAAERRRLAERGALRPGSLAVLEPGSPIDDEERALLRDLQVATVLVPRAFAERGAPPPALRGLTGRGLLGGAGAVSSPLEERAALVHSLPDVDRTLAFELATRGGYDLAAETFDLEFGRFGGGAPADLVVLEAPLPAPISASTAPDQLERIGPRHVRHVVVAGEVVVENGRATKLDARKVREGAARELTRVWKRAAS